MSTNADIVRKIQDAIGRGAIIETMAYMARDIRWAVNAMDRDAAPWLKEYRGRQGVLAFFEETSKVEWTDFEIKAMIEDGDLVVVRMHFAFNVPGGGHVDMDEAQIWQVRDGKVQSVDLFPDTLALAQAFA